DEVPGPHVVPVRRPVTYDPVGAAAQPTLLVLLLRHFQPLTLPQPPHPLAVHTPALLPQQRPDPAVAEPRMLPDQFQHPTDQLPFAVVGPPGHVTLRPTRLTHDPAGPTLRHPRKLSL